VVGSLRELGVIASNARSFEAPLVVFKDAEAFVKEEALVVVEDVKFKRRYLGVLRLVTKLDPLLTTSQRSAIIEKPEIASEGLDIPYEISYVRIIGEISSGEVKPPTTPPTPRSRVYIVESPSDIKLDLGGGLVIGIHKYSGIEIPMKPDALRYHIAVIGTTGTGKSRLVKALVDEVLEKTNWSVIIFDHTGMDYTPFWTSSVVRADEIVLDVDTIAEGLRNTLGYAERAVEEYVPLALVKYIVCKTNQQLCSQLERSQLALTRKQLEHLTLDLSSKKMWNTSELIKVIAETATKLGARSTTSQKLSLYISLFAEQYVKRLNNMSKTVDELVERARRERVLVVDLSYIETETRRVIAKRFLERLWEIIAERLEPVNTLVVIDEAHNYACQQGCWPSNTLIEKTLREGRKWNLGVVLASQRVLDFTPDVRNNVNTVFFSRLQTPYDFDQLRNFVDLAGVRPESLSLLETREFFFAGLGNPLKYPMLIKVREVAEPTRRAFQ
jgi:DNA helicase HerA-like ATPase